MQRFLSLFSSPLYPETCKLTDDMTNYLETHVPFSQLVIYSFVLVWLFSPAGYEVLLLPYRSVTSGIFFKQMI